MENIHGIHLKIIKDKFLKILVCEAQIHNFTYKMITSEMAIIASYSNDRYFHKNVN